MPRPESARHSKSRANRDVDIRRELARAVVTRGWGLLELRPDAHEPRGRLPAGHDDRRSSPGRRPPRCVTSLAIADKELRSYFASPIAYILIGLFALLFGWFFYVYLDGVRAAERTDDAVRRRRRRRTSTR